MDVYEEARKITFDVAAEALTGLQVGPEVDNFCDTFVQILNLGMVAIDDDDYTRRLGQLKEHLYTLLLPKVQERRRAIPSMMCWACWCRTEMILVVLSAMSNCLHTPTFSWLLYLLTQNPDYLQRVLAEHGIA